MINMDITTKKKAMKKAKELGEHASEREVQELDSKLPALKKGVIAKVWDKVIFLWEQAKNPEISLRLKLTIIGALLYLVLPIDVVPDTIPCFGLVDDLTVILAVVHEVSKYVLPKLEKKAEEKLFEIGYQKIDEKLSAIFTSILITTIITFTINVIGCTILVIKPFGNPASRSIAISIFVTVFVYSLIRFIIYLKDYGQMTKKIATAVCKKKSISEGLSEFICTEYKYIAYFFDGLQIVKSVVPELKQIPEAPQIVSVFERHSRKRIILFVICIGLYISLVMITKFILFKL